MSESKLKKVKTNNFKTTNEALNYFETYLAKLPDYLWEKILLSTNTTDIRDITLLCRVNKEFQQICVKGNIFIELI